MCQIVDHLIIAAMAVIMAGTVFAAYRYARTVFTARRITRTAATLVVAMVMLSCTKEDQPALKLHYEFNQDQPHQVVLNVVPMNGVDLQLEDMLLEVNADYFNRYGIAIHLVLQAEQSLPDNVVNGNTIFTPEMDQLTLFVIPDQYIKFAAHGYGSIINGKPSIVLGEESQTNRVLAHEIGHILGLDHTDLDNNVMTPRRIAGQYDVPNDFTGDQVQLMIQNINQLQP